MELCDTLRRSTLRKSIVTGALVLGTILLPRAVAEEPQKPFTEDEVIKLLKGDVAPERVEALARQSGIAFQLTPETVARLRKAGATDKLLEALRRLEPAGLSIKSTPGGAQVFLDDKLAGTTNAEGELELAQLTSGEHKIRLTLAGYEDYKRTINLLAGPPTRVSASLQESLVPLLSIKSNPARAQVFLDGKLEGTTDAEGELELLKLPPGEHNIRLTLAGYEDYEQTINLLAGHPASIPATLKKSAAPPLAVTTFRVKLEHKGSGELIIGNGRLQFHADHDGGNSFDFPLSEITYGPFLMRSVGAPHGTLDGFYLQPQDGKASVFHSDSTPAILQLLQQWGSQSPR